MNINQVIIWGHTLHDHTHSYIHNAFYRAFKHMGYKTYWYSDNGASNYPEETADNFENTLFLSHGLVCKNIPLSDTCFYILHNAELKLDNNRCQIFSSDESKNNIKPIEQSIPKDNFVNIQVYTNDCIGRDIPDKNIQFHYYMEPPHNIIYFPWATDLLPHEIDNNIHNLSNHKMFLCCNFIGMITPPWKILSNVLKKYQIRLNNFGGSFDINSSNNKSIDENQQLIQQSIIAPALQTEWQVNAGYIPCRIFKNISYGKMGITNSKTVFDLFNQKIIYSNNIEELVYNGVMFEKRTDKISIMSNLMTEVRDNHTYINRINYMLNYLEKYKQVVVDK